MNISTLQLLALMACGVTVIVGISIATTSRSRLLKAGGYVFTAVLIAAVGTEVLRTPTQDADAAHARNIIGILLLAAAGWAVASATRAYLRK